MGLKPILCVERNLRGTRAGQTEDVVISQTTKGLAGVGADELPKVVIAYEPVWAIGTGETCDAADANQVIGKIRETIAELYTPELAQKVRIQYGGSVKPSNITEIMEQSEIDGALVGGASLNAEDFVAIVKY